MRKQYTVRTAVIIMATAWIFMALFVGIASGIHKNYDEPSPVSVCILLMILFAKSLLLYPLFSMNCQLWCWVGPHYQAERVWGEYFWLWVTLFVAIATYIPLFLLIQGYIAIDERYWWRVKWYWNGSGEDKVKMERLKAPSLALLA